MAITLTLSAVDNVLLQNTGGGDVILKGTTVDFHWYGSYHIKFLEIIHGDPGSASDWIQCAVTGESPPVYIVLHGYGGVNARLPLYYYPGSVPVWTAKNYAVGDIVIGDGSGLGYEDVYRCTSAHYGTAAYRPVSGAQWIYRWTVDNNNSKDTGERTFLINKSVQ